LTSIVAHAYRRLSRSSPDLRREVRANRTLGTAVSSSDLIERAADAPAGDAPAASITSAVETLRLAKPKPLPTDDEWRPYVHAPSRRFKPDPDRTIGLDSFDAVKATVPRPDTLYRFQNVGYRMDEHARPVEASGVLRSCAERYRMPAVDLKIGRDGVPGDIGFHLMANRFGGVGGPLNVVPGNSALNIREYSRAEDRIDTFIRFHHPKPVVGSFRAHYPPLAASPSGAPTRRPEKFVVQWGLASGPSPYTLVFENRTLPPIAEASRGISPVRRESPRVRDLLRRAKATSPARRTGLEKAASMKRASSAAASPLGALSAPAVDGVR